MPRIVAAVAGRTRTPRRNARTPSARRVPVRRDRSASVHNGEWNEEEERDRAVPEGFDPDEDLLHMEIPPPPVATHSGQSESRLIITRIELENFKSFYGHQVIGPLHKSFTAIIGPNGSGKSNVIDALLFVFGYRSAKLRSKKLGSLIHNSKDELNKCTVTVYMQKFAKKGANWEIVEGSEISFSRSAYRNNSSQYRLNGVEAHYPEITAELRAAGVDIVHNRFLILQGEVEQISQMRPKAIAQGEEGMLEYLEDIIGSNRLKAPTEKITYKLSLIEEERTQQRVRVKQAQKELADLEKPLKEASEAVKLENNIALASNRMLCAKRLKLKDKMEAMAPRHMEIEKEIEEVKTKEVASLAVKLKDAKKREKAAQRELNEGQEALNALGNELRENEQSRVRLECDQKRLSDQQAKLETESTKEQKKLGELRLLPEKAEKRIEELQLELEETGKLVASLRAQVEENKDKLAKETDKLVSENRSVEEKIMEQAELEQQITRELELAKDRICNLRSDEDKQREKLSSLIRQLADAEDKLTQKQKELKNSKEQLPIVQRLLFEANNAVERIRTQEAALVNQVQELRASHEQARQSDHEYKSNNRLTNALMTEKKEGRIPGIFGRLGDLGAIDEKYDVAISNTCYELNNFVVDTVETAQRCVQFLKDHRLGLASFLVLEKQRHLASYMNARLNIPENARRLFDLIRVEDEQVRLAFYYAVRDTLVVEDIITANRTSTYGGQRWRVVTLKGEVVDRSGSMTGGGRSQQRGLIGQTVKVRTRDSEGGLSVGELARRLNEATEELRAVREKLGSAESDCAKRRTECVKLEAANSANLGTEIGLLNDRVNSLRTQVEVQRGKIQEATADPEEIRKEERKVNELKQKNLVLGEIIDVLRLDSIALTEKIDSANEKLVGESQKQLNAAEKKKKDAEVEISKHRVSVKNNSANMAKAESRIKELEEELARLTDKLANVDQRCEELKADAAALEVKIEEKKSEVQQAQEAYDETREAEKAITAEEQELQKRLKQLHGQLKEIEEKLKVWRGKRREMLKSIAKLKVYYFSTITLHSASSRQQNEPVDADEEGESAEQAEEEEDLSRLPLFEDGESGATAENQVGDQGQEEGEHSGMQEIDDETADPQPGPSNKRVSEPHAHANRSPQLGGYLRKVPVYDEETVRTFDAKELEEVVIQLEHTKTTRKKGLNIGIIMDYTAKAKRCAEETASLRQLDNHYGKHETQRSKLEKQRLAEFLEGFHIINDHLKEIYQKLTLTGDADLDLANKLDPFSEGVEFKVRPRNKGWKQMSNLSGGEKTLASLALVFALHHYRPCPFYVMDEIDAALDFMNVAIVATYITDRTKDAQFLVVSLRNNMFEISNYLAGIYKVDDCTHNVQINPKTVDKQQKRDKKRLKLIQMPQVTQSRKRPQLNGTLAHVGPSRPLASHSNKQTPKQVRAVGRNSITVRKGRLLPDADRRGVAVPTPRHEEPSTTGEPVSPLAVETTVPPPENSAHPPQLSVTDIGQLVVEDEPALISSFNHNVTLRAQTGAKRILLPTSERTENSTDFDCMQPPVKRASDELRISADVESDNPT